MECVRVDVPAGVQHLLGVVQVVARDTALVRTGLLSRGARAVLEARFDVVDVPESPEVVRERALNFVVLAPRRVLMPAGCERFEDLLRARRVEIAGRVPVRQLLRGGGGLACAIGILSRREALS
jgi:N-dimethylarginine dimethylaminohydrolase